MFKLFTLTIVFSLFLSAGMSFAGSHNALREQAIKEIMESGDGPKVTDPTARQAMRSQLEQMLSAVPDGQIQMMLEEMKKKKLHNANTPAQKPAPLLTPEQEAANQAWNWTQVEPYVKTIWEANKKFDAVIAAKEEQIKADMAKYPYEAYAQVAGFKIAFDVETDENAGAWEVIQQSAQNSLPKDGHYQFDFSQLRTTFDPKQVEEEIDGAYARYRVIASEYGEKMGELFKKYSDQGQIEEAMDRLTRSYQPKASDIAAGLRETLGKLRPSYFYQVPQIILNRKTRTKIGG